VAQRGALTCSRAILYQTSPLSDPPMNPASRLLLVRRPVRHVILDGVDHRGIEQHGRVAQRPGSRSRHLSIRTAESSSAVERFDSLDKDNARATVTEMGYPVVISYAS
jgi:hypothetical protein